MDAATFGLILNFIGAFALAIATILQNRVITYIVESLLSKHGVEQTDKIPKDVVKALQRKNASVRL